MNTIYYKRPRSDDPYLEYDSSIENYYKKVTSFIIPFDNLNLCLHLTNFAKFIDALYKQDEIVSKIKSIQDGQSKSRNDDHLWFLDAEVEEEEVIEMKVEGEGVVKINDRALYDTVCNLAWEWHDNIKSRKNTFTSLYAINYFLSWGSFCRTYYLNVMLKEKSLSSKDLLERCATDYKFTEIVDSSHYIIVHYKPIMTYSLKFIFEAIKVLIPVLYIYSYSIEMKDYLYHLFLRYCSILSVSCATEDEEFELLDHPARFKYHDIGLEDEDDDDEDNGCGEEDYNEFKKTCVKMNDRYSITSDYIYEGEALFYSQLSRVNQSVILGKMAEEYPLYFNGYDTPQESILLVKLCLDAWNKFVHSLSLHKLLGTSVKEGFHTDAMHLFLYHGEKGRYINSWPESNHEPGDIISQTRPDDFTLLQQVRQYVIKDISTTFYKGFIQFLNNTVTNERFINLYNFHNNNNANLNVNVNDNNNVSPSKRDEYTPKAINGTNMSHLNCNYNRSDINSNICSNGDRLSMMDVPYIDHEKECVLATKVCTLNWFRYNVVESWKLINESFIIEELCDNMSSIDNIFIDHQRIRSHKLMHPPYLVRLMRIFYVIDINHDQMKTYKTDVFPKAYFIWLSLLRKYNYIKDFPLKEDADKKIQLNLNQMIRVIIDKLV